MVTRAPNLLYVVRARVTGEIGGDEAAFAGDHVAGGTPGFAEENCLSADGIAGQFDGLLCPLKSAQVGYYRFDVRRFEGVEGRHSGARDAVLDNVHDLRVGEALDLWIVGDVGTAFGAPSVEAMAGCAGRGESFLAAGREWVAIFLRALLLGLWRGGKTTGGPQGRQNQPRL